MFVLQLSAHPARLSLATFVDTACGRYPERHSGGEGSEKEGTRPGNHRGKLNLHLLLASIIN
jgi:hypothetical protein